MRQPTLTWESVQCSFISFFWLTKLLFLLSASTFLMIFEFVGLVGREYPYQNRRQKVFNRGICISAGVLRLCVVAWHSKNRQKLHWFLVLYVTIWEELGALFGGLIPPKLPGGDGTECRFRTGVIKLSLAMYPFSIPIDEHVPLKFLMTKRLWKIPWMYSPRNI